jgi:LysM repeat protein
MSVATELPPVVFVPERARSTPSGRVVPTGRRHLRLVPPCDVAGGDGGASRVQLHQVAEGPLRLTRRGVVALTGLTALLGGALLLLAHLSLGLAPSTPQASSGTAAPNGVVTVQSGDTLWSIAARVAPSRDPRLVVAELRARNGLSTVSLLPGQTLKVG